MKKAMVALTFDDGFKTDLTVGLQMQLDRGMTPKGTSYIVPSFVSAVRLTPAEQMQMASAGWDLQCHSQNHVLGGPQGGSSGLTADELHKSMQDVNAYFESLGLPHPEHHAYPGGANTKLMRDIWGTYRKTLRTTQNWLFTENINFQQLPSQTVENPANLEYYKKYLLTAKKYNLHCTLFLHELATPEMQEHYGKLLDFMIDEKINLVTISEMYNELAKG